MRMGLILSGFLHLSLIGFGIFTIAGSNLDHHALDVESIAIELAPIADEMTLREGSNQAPSEEPPAPKPTQKPEINATARHVGDGQVDNAAPLNPHQPVREVEATPPPVSTAQATIANSEPEQAKPAEPESPQTTPQIASPAAPETAVETAAMIPPLPQNAPQPKQKPIPIPPQQSRQAEKATDDNVEKIAQLIDRTPTQGGGMRRAQEPAGAGATRNIGDNQQLAQTIQNVIGGCLKDKARITALSGSRSDNLIVRVHMRLNRDGSIDGVPDLSPSGGEASEREIAVTQGFAALARCAPFNGLPPERYDDGWFDVTLNWRPLD